MMTDMTSTEPNSLASDGGPPLRVLVTGANGFLGRHVVAELRGSGLEVIAMVRSRSSISSEWDDGVEVLESDMRGLANLSMKGGQRIDSIVHCAALSAPWGTRSQFRDANVSGTAHVVSFAQRHGVQRLVFVSSPSVYSSRSDRVGIRETDPISPRPLNVYIESKIAAEKIVREAQAQGRVPEVVILRPRGLVGVGDTSLVPRLLRVNSRIGIPLFNRGTNVVDLTSVENVALAVRLSISSEAASGKTYNISNGDPREFRELLGILMDMTGTKPRYWNASARVIYPVAALCEWVYSRLLGNPEPPITSYTVSTIAHSQTLDISAARRDFGYAPRISIEESLEAFARDYVTRTGQGTS